MIDDLFAEQSDTIALLPYDGDVVYFGSILNALEADHYFQALRHEIDWQPDQAVIFGKHIVTKRKVAWHADQPYQYTYSKTTKTAQPWTPSLLALKALIERHSGEYFNSCLLNLYHDGSEGMSWHSDAEKELVEQGAIASLSLGCERKFSFKHKQSKETRSVILEHGSLLIMKGQTQQHWLHQLPTTKKATQARINLTFRRIKTA
ncbi:alpha-ketoglutarate-dependent dioxygenase AlkB family protein [Marinomonas ostreistagni]|uniref:alpha-ketoglutarate-dependent dioxygenase AlkB family protein n=1 Tax=Marinomonas ostreistagni TaxID=359209 RepID=UPI0019517DB7|nr:alpha-ketoglutarate-dependent dioxygenase AlkB [Marinomonas ostreistagni]MBM6551723.1 alpha-ketoglutarate-dependent dioxygenase AlkB [Marinomonas ostreistagni]